LHTYQARSARRNVTYVCFFEKCAPSISNLPSLIKEANRWGASTGSSKPEEVWKPSETSFIGRISLMPSLKTAKDFQSGGEQTLDISSYLLLLPGILIVVAGSLLHIFQGQSWVDTSGHAWGSDDAFISFRYALNAAEGHGFVFNPGERVEGYSNPLYVAALALVALASSGAALYPAALIINTVALVGLILFLGSWIRRNAGPLAALVGTTGVALFPPLWAAAASGLETPVVLLLQSIIVAGTLSLSRSPAIPSESRSWHLVAGASLLSILIRPDGFIIPVLAGLVVFASGERRIAVRLFAVIATGVAVMTVWRLAYYGLPLPMTYYAKVTGTLDQRFNAGFGQLMREALPTGMLPHLLVLAILTPFLGFDLLRRLPYRCAPKPHAILAFFGLAWLAYWIYIGGDVFSERFLLIVAVISWIAISLSLRGHRRILPLVTVPLVLQLSPLVEDGRFDYHPKDYDMWVELGVFLGGRYPGATIAVDAAGKVPFYSGLTTIDMLGLNDAHIGMSKSNFVAAGHSKMDPAYVLGRRPDLIAAWVMPQMDMGWGISQERYLANGYCLRYLVQSTRAKPAAAIIDLQETPHQFGALYEAGYSYGVAEQAGPSGCPPPPMPEDGIVDFSISGNSAPYKVSGWSVTESWGTWSEGAQAELRLPLPTGPASDETGDIDLQISANVFSPFPDRPQQVELVVNDVPVARWSFAPEVAAMPRHARVPAKVAAQHSPATVIFRVEHPASPASAGLSADTRELGIGLKQLRMQPAQK
jgi:hypothetical protein